MTDAVKVLRGLEEMYATKIRFIERLRHCIETYPNQNWGDAMSRGQIKSKRWLLNTLCQTDLAYDVGDVAICGGWLGILAAMMFESPQISATHITSYDLDPSCTEVACELNLNRAKWFAGITADCNDINYFGFTTVVNTSCEHFGDFSGWYEKVAPGQIVVLQSNDFFDHPEHVNCVSNEEELAESAPMSEVRFKGSIETHLYNRFMVIGVK